MEDVTDWLPHAAFTDREILVCARNVVASWSAHWFSRPAEAIAFAAGTQTGGTTEDDLPISFHGEIARICLAENGAALLFEAATGSAPPKKPTVDDRNVMQLLAERVALDLIARLEAAFGPHAASHGEHIALPVNLIVDEQAQAAFVLDVSRFAFAAPLKLQWGRSLPQRNVGTLRDALAPQPMRLEALLGCARLTMGDVRTMAPGDVLVLDREVEERVELVVADSNTSIGRGKFRFDGEYATVEL